MLDVGYVQGMNDILSKQGLTGVKPVVHLKQNVVISPEHALRLTIGEA